jgi:hypothetical protein
VVSQVAGWHLGNSIARLVNLIGLVPILATASAEYYRAQPDADWSNSDNIAGHALWTVGRWLARVIPPLKDDTGASGGPVSVRLSHRR